MTLTLNKIVTGLVGLAMVAGLAATFTVERAHAAEMSLSDLVELFIALEIIPADQADAALAAVEDIDETPATPSMSCYFTNNLSQGDTGADVMELQKFLNGMDFTVAASGAGSPGLETQYYGPATAAAVASMQEAYAADILTPLGLTTGTGYFGASTRAAANELCAAAGDDDDDDMPTIPTLPGDDDDDDDMSDDDDDMSELSGEGTLKTYELDDADEDELMEGEEDAVIAQLTLEAEDGDVLLKRATFEIVGTSAEESDPWDVFETFSLWYDGEMLGEFMADDEDDYLDEDNGEFRFTGIDFVLEEDDEVELLVAATVMNSVDGASTDQDWTITGTHVRYFDADDVATDDVTTDELPSGSATFSIIEEGADDGADIESSSADPDEALIQVETDSDESDEYTVFVFDIDVDDDSSDLELNDAVVDIEITNSDVSTTSAEQVISSVYLIVDGEEVEGDVTSANDDDDIAPSASLTVEYTFEFDGDVELEGGDEYEVELVVVFEGQNTDNTPDDYTDGVTIQASVDGADWELEGSDGDDDNLSGTRSSEVHTLQGVVPTISDVTVDESRSEAGDSGTFSFEFTIAADGDDDVTFDIADNSAVDGATDDVMFTITGATTTPADIATAVLSLVSDSGDAAYAGTTWTVAEGDEATFVLDVTVTTTGAGDNGNYRVRLDEIAGVEVDLLSGSLQLTDAS